MRLAVYTDYVYRRKDGVIYAERAFALFLAALAPHVEQLVLVGRLAPHEEKARYALPATVELASLQHYSTLSDPVAAMRSLVGSVRQMVRTAGAVDVLWVLGPYPHAIALALIGMIRGRTVVLGVRQDWPSYVRMRRPRSRWMHWSADAMEWAWRALAHKLPVVAVGSELRAHYAHAPEMLELAVSLVPSAAVLTDPPRRDYSGELRVLSVGRLDEEKNPLLLADVLALLRTRDPRWRLIVCGDGDLAAALAARCAELGVGESIELLGYVPIGDQLFDLYRDSHALLHVSWTEGFPQVLIEAFAYGLPVVATAVGGVRAGVREAALLIEPGDAAAAAAALTRVATDPDLRDELIATGLRRARDLSLEAQIGRLTSFLAAADARRARPARTAS